MNIKVTTAICRARGMTKPDFRAGIKAGAIKGMVDEQTGTIWIDDTEIPTKPKSEYADLYVSEIDTKLNTLTIKDIDKECNFIGRIAEAGITSVSIKDNCLVIKYGKPFRFD